MSNAPLFLRPAARAAVCVVLLALITTAEVHPSDARPADYRGRRLVEVLAELKGQGLDLIYSSAVVDNELRVASEPTATEPHALLDEILRPLDLKAQDGPGESILIVPRTATGDEPDDRVPPMKGHPGFVTEIVVTPNRHTLIRQEQASSRAVSGEQALLAPTIGGDVSRVIELLPGVTAPDSSAAFNVRGSTAADVSLILDGLEMYDPFHLRSFQSPFSVIDSNVVDRIDFFGGGFTADLGDRHGGFVEISTLAPFTAQGEIEVGTLNTRLSYSDLTADGRGSWLVSGRAWYPEKVQDTTELGSGEQLDPWFADLYAKAEFGVTDRHRLSVHALAAYDRLTFQETDEEINERVDALTRNAYVWVRGLSAWSPSATSETVLSGGRIERLRSGISSSDGPIAVDDDRTVDFFGVKHDARWTFADRHAIKAGADLRWLDAAYRYSDQRSDPVASRLNRLDSDGLSIGVFAAYRVRLSPQAALELGTRWDRQDYTNDNQLSPRFNFLWRPTERSEFRMALGRYHQSQRIHELQVEDAELEFARSEVSEQAEVSFQHRLGSGRRVRIDAYYRRLSDLRSRYENLFEPIELFPETNEDRELIRPESARLRGVELLVSSRADSALFWWASYVRSSAEDRIEGRNEPRSWDQAHAGKFLIGYRVDDRWSLSLTGSVHTGWPTTAISGKIPAGGTEIEPVLGPRNAENFSTYSRFDLKSRRAIGLSRGRLWMTLEVLNLTDRDNAFGLDEIDFRTLPDGSIETTRLDDHWLGATASFSILWEF